MLPIETYQLEMSVGGAIIVYGGDVLKDKISLVRMSDFSDEVIKSVIKKTASVEFNLNAAITKLNPEEKECFIKMTQAVTGDSAFEAEVKLLQECASKNRLRKVLTDAVMGFDDDKFTVEWLKTVAEQEERRQPIDTSMLWLDDYIENFGKPQSTINTGYSFLDNIVGGMRIPSVVAIGAKPSTGKTAFAMNIALHAMLNKLKCQIFSLEMGNEMILNILTSMWTGLDYDKIQKGGLTPKEVEKGKKIGEWVKTSGLVRIHDDINTIEDISSECRKFAPDLVIIDYIQIVRSLNKHKDTRELINYISSECKVIAKRQNCVVIILSQLSRTPGVPTMSDLKESGNLEADSDLIMLLHRPYVSDKANADPTEMYVLVDKNKFGRCGKKQLYFDGEHQKITEVLNR